MIAAIPTVGEASQLPTLVAQLLEEPCVSSVLLTVNERDREAAVKPLAQHHVHVVCVDGSIYEGWNFAMRFTRNLGAAKLALLNDDLTIEPGSLTAASTYMDDDRGIAIMGLDYRPDAPLLPAGAREVRGTYQFGGLHGCAMVVDVTKVREVDPMFEWWYGDDDLVMGAIADGHRVALAEGCRVHHQGEATASKRPWTQEARVRDAERYNKKWAGGK